MMIENNRVEHTRIHACGLPKCGRLKQEVNKITYYEKDRQNGNN